MLREGWGKVVMVVGLRTKEKKEARWEGISFGKFLEKRTKNKKNPIRKKKKRKLPADGWCVAEGEGAVVMKWWAGWEKKEERGRTDDAIIKQMKKFFTMRRHLIGQKKNPLLLFSSPPLPLPLHPLGKWGKENHNLAFTLMVVIIFLFALFLYYPLGAKAFRTNRSIFVTPFNTFCPQLN